MRLVERVHDRCIVGRRARVLSDQLTRLVPPNARVLDIGCGDGLIASLIQSSREDVCITGVDVLVRPDAKINVTPFNGDELPFDDNSFDCVMLVDVLHHTADPMVLLREAGRVARNCVLLKDHTREGLLAGTTLRFMDRVGNSRHGVSLPYNYWRREQWRDAFNSLGWELDVWRQNLALYQWPANLLFERSLHFVARLHPSPH